MTLKGTTICAVLKDGKIAVAGDGQVTMGESTIFKATARKVRRIHGLCRHGGGCIRAVRSV